MMHGEVRLPRGEVPPGFQVYPSRMGGLAATSERPFIAADNAGGEG